MRLPWRRVADTPVSEVALSGRAYLEHPADGVLEVRAGTTTEGMTVYATVADPQRWFVLFRGVTVPEGVWALILWEVEAGTGQRALKRRASGGRDWAPVIMGLLDVPISNDPAGWRSATRL